MNRQMEIVKNLWQRRNVKIGVGIAVVLFGALALKPSNDANRVDPDNAHFCRVQRGDLVVSILQTGELQAKTSREIMNDAYRDAKIIEIVEDGDYVTNGQLIVELESSELMERFLDQQSDVAEAKAGLMTARETQEITKLKDATDLENATLKIEISKLDLKKYTEAEYPQMILKAESEIMLAEEELKKARSTLKGTQELFNKGYSNQQDLDSDMLGVQRKEIEVRNKTTDLKILKNYTSIKQLKELKNEGAKAESELKRLKKTISSNTLSKEAEIESRKTRLEIEKNQLVIREEQFANTKIYADFDGQVFYPNERRKVKIEKGANINFRQKILSYPDLSAWNIKVGIPEAMIDKVEVGQEVVAALDAVPGILLRGRVEKISAVPDSQHWFSAGVKTYTIIVNVSTQPEAQLKPGMSATVEIITDQLRDVLYAPIQSVVSEKEKHFVYVVKRGRKALQEVEIGKYNTHNIEIIYGLKEDEKLLLYAEVALEADAKLKKSPLAEESKNAKKQGQE